LKALSDYVYGLFEYCYVMHKFPATAVPVFKLYGETAAWPTPDMIHSE
jgi:AraC family transcriptional activator of pobA